uniref:Uncharacterized protein n=1 Tax=Ciona savignyi TaxID=51511 RepID=H2ZGG0_CIOSA
MLCVDNIEWMTCFSHVAQPPRTPEVTRSRAIQLPTFSIISWKDLSRSPLLVILSSLHRLWSRLSIQCVD